jgi:hypothetical protein
VATLEEKIICLEEEVKLKAEAETTLQGEVATLKGEVQVRVETQEEVTTLEE